MDVKDNNNQDFDLPYFDTFLREFKAQKSPILEKIIGTNVHWGYWKNPKSATCTPEDFYVATDNLTRELLNWAKPKPGQQILDVGCGFGGTIALMNKTYSDLTMTGINIDPRQIERARKLVQPQACNNNSIDFVVGDACKLPFPDQSFDTLLAVECIFHFPSRIEFFREARRVLRPGGKLILSDFVVRILCIPFVGLIYLLYRKDAIKVYGTRNSFTTMFGYQSLARRVGMKLQVVQDITTNTIPTYTVLRNYADHSGFNPRTLIRAQAVTEFGSKLGLLRYLNLAFEKPL